MEVRRSLFADIPRILEIYSESKKFMAQNGNPTQWPEGYPSPELVEADVAENGYVVIDGGEIVGVFVFAENTDEAAYNNIDGAWENDEPYAVIHRCATGGTRGGVGRFILDWCFNKFSNIRVDTHESNVPMKSLLEKTGYHYCGKIWYEGYGERLAFQRVAYQKYRGE
jgi:hypothetical protein